MATQLSASKELGNCWRGISKRNRRTLNRLACEVDPAVCFVYQLDASGILQLIDMVQAATSRFSQKDIKFLIPKLHRVYYIKANGYHH